MGFFYFYRVQLLALPTVGTRNLVRHLNQDEEQSKEKFNIYLCIMANYQDVKSKLFNSQKLVSSILH